MHFGSEKKPYIVTWYALYINRILLNRLQDSFSNNTFVVPGKYQAIMHSGCQSNLLAMDDQLMLPSRVSYLDNQPESKSGQEKGGIGESLSSTGRHHDRTTVVMNSLGVGPISMKRPYLSLSLYAIRIEARMGET